LENSTISEVVIDTSLVVAPDPETVRSLPGDELALVATSPGLVPVGEDGTSTVARECVLGSAG